MSILKVTDKIPILDCLELRAIYVTGPGVPLSYTYRFFDPKTKIKIEDSVIICTGVPQEPLQFFRDVARKGSEKVKYQIKNIFDNKISINVMGRFLSWGDYEHLFSAKRVILDKANIIEME